MSLNVDKLAPAEAESLLLELLARHFMDKHEVARRLVVSPARVIQFAAEKRLHFINLGRVIGKHGDRRGAKNIGGTYPVLFRRDSVEAFAKLERPWGWKTGVSRKKRRKS